LDMTDITNMFSQPAPRLHWGGAIGLWDICRNKVIGVPVLDLFFEQAVDPDLKAFIKTGIETVTLPGIKNLQDFLEKEGLTYPPIAPRKKIDDEQIARSLREILRLSLYLDFHSLMEITREDVKKIVWDIVVQDKKAFDAVIDLKRKKGWLLNPPNV